MEDVNNWESGDLVTLKVKAGASKDSLEWSSERSEWRLYLRAPAIEGKANKALKEFFKKNYKLKVEIDKGERSSEKRIKIL